MVEIEVQSQSVLDALNRLLRAGQNMHPVMDAVGMSLESRISSRFETMTDPNGVAWAPWKPSTIKSYPKDGNKRKLDRYGDMLDKLTHLAQDDSVEVGFGASAAWRGKPVSPALFHEFGTSRMERRGLLTANPETGALGTEDEKTVLDAINAHLRQAWER